MLESFVTAFIIYFVVIDTIGNATVFLAVTSHLDRNKKLRVAVEGAAIATAIMLFFALCGAWASPISMSRNIVAAARRRMKSVTFVMIFL